MRVCLRRIRLVTFVSGIWRFHVSCPFRASGILFQCRFNIREFTGFPERRRAAVASCLRAVSASGKAGCGRSGCLNRSRGRRIS